MLLENNGRASSSKRTRQLNVRYFFIRVEYCPTADMIGDFFPKPLQGALFTKLNIIMNVPSSISLFQDDHSPPSSQDHRRVLEPVPPVNDWNVHVKKQK